MKGFTTAIAVLGAGLSFGACYCPRCPVDTVDEVGVVEPTRTRSGELGALASVIQLYAAGGGLESPEVRAIDSALASGSVVTGTFHASPRNPNVRGYVLMKDGRIALDRRLVRAAAPDPDYIANPQVWPLIPFLYAAGHRLVHAGTWNDSVHAASGFVARLADNLESGRAAEALPPSADPRELAGYLRRWVRIR